MKLGGNGGGTKEPTEQGIQAIKEMTDKATMWYEWTIRKEISVHPHNDYVPREYLQKIHEWMFPYVYRLYETDNITLEQMKDFSTHCNDLIFDLRVRCEEATWIFHWQEKDFFQRLKWRWKNKRLKRYGLRDFERLCREARFVPFI